jgi:hypothetical protein
VNQSATIVQRLWNYCNVLHADVYLNGALTYQNVTTFQVTVPLDGSTEIRVTAPGYKPWGLIPMSADSSKIMSGPVRLVRQQ